MTNSNLYDILVDFIENNKSMYDIDYKSSIENLIENNKSMYDIDYKSSIENLKELLEEIEQDYKNIEGEE